MSSPTLEPSVTAVPPVKRGRGRPKGSKNKPKAVGSAPKKPRTTASAARKPRGSSKPKTMKGVEELLSVLGVTNLPKVSKCLKAGILNGHVKLKKPEEDTENTFGLNQVLTTGNCCYSCGRKVKCTVRDVLYQPDFGGYDYEMGAPNATVKCKGKECGGMFVTAICYGQFRLDSGKFHNHCTACPRYGRCLGDYRERHCFKCGDHYHGVGFMEGGCYTCDKTDDSESS